MFKYVSDWRRVEENQRAALAGIVQGISRLDAVGRRTRCCSAPTAHASTISLECYSFVADHDAPFYQGNHLVA